MGRLDDEVVILTGAASSVFLSGVPCWPHDIAVNGGGALY